MTIDRADYLLEKAEEPSVYFLRYTRVRKNSGEMPIFIFEGIDDPKYYTPRLFYRFGSSWSPLSVDGKLNVLELREDIRRNKDYCNDKAAFFVDSDFDDDENTPEDVYKTPCYSIENLYLSDGTIRHLILSLAEFSTQTDEEAIAIEYVLKKYKGFYSSYINSKNAKRIQIVFLYVRKRLQDKKVSLDSLFSMKHDFSNGYSLNIGLKAKGDTITKGIDRADFIYFIRKSKIARRIISGQCKHYRGKQQISFARAFVASIKSENSTLQSELRSETGLKICFKNTNIGADLIADLSSYAETPRCLTQFLDALPFSFAKKLCNASTA